MLNYMRSIVKQEIVLNLFLKKYLFIWLCQFLVAAFGIFIAVCGIFVVACGIFSCGVQALSCGMQALRCSMRDLVP